MQDELKNRRKLFEAYFAAESDIDRAAAEDALFSNLRMQKWIDANRETIAEMTKRPSPQDRRVRQDC